MLEKDNGITYGSKVGQKVGVTIHIPDKKKQANVGYTESGTSGGEVNKDGSWKYISGM